MTTDLLKKVKETISRYQMISPGDRLVVAVSGGPDSVCLLDILHSLSEDLAIDLVVAHYNHGLREREDEQETALVEDMAKSMGLPWAVEKATHLKPGDSSLEEKARVARYDFLEKVRRNHNAQKIAMGHNLNDQAETVLMRLLRGSGLAGLAGIPPVREEHIIRPLIEISRDSIIKYLADKNIPYAIDSSNTDVRYTRNRIRQELIPILLEYQPDLVAHFGRLSDIMRKENEFMESLSRYWVAEESATDEEGGISIPVSSFKSVHSFSKGYVIRNLLKRAGHGLMYINSRHIESVLKMIDSNRPQAMINLPNNIIVKRSYDKIRFTRGSDSVFSEFSYEIAGPGALYLIEIDRQILIEVMETEVKPDVGESKDTAYLDADLIEFPLTARNIRPGDRFIPLGMKGHKKIKNYFIDLKVPSVIRKSTPILMMKDTPIWLCGFRVDDRFKLTSATKKVLKASIVGGKPF